MSERTPYQKACAERCEWCARGIPRAVEIAALEEQLEQARKDLDYQTDARYQDAKDNIANFKTWKKTVHDPLMTERDQLLARAEKAEEDSRRLDWLTANTVSIAAHQHPNCSGDLYVRGRKYRAATLREAIDAAKAKGRA